MKNSIVLDPDYWDCSCEEQYIHPMATKTCPKCGTHEADGPESRVDEVAKPELHYQGQPA